MSTTAWSVPATAVREKRNVGMGIFFLIVAVAIAGLFALNTTSDMTTTFGLNPGAKTNAPQLDDWVVSTQTMLWILSIITAFIGGYQLAKGFKRVNLVLLVVALIFIFAFLTWAATVLR